MKVKNNSILDIKELGRNRIPLNIQLLASDPDKEKDEEDDKKKDDDVDKKKKLYTKEELTETIDKAVARAIAKERARAEEELAKQKEEKEKEKELAKLSAEERKQKELENERIKFEEERKQFKRERLVSQTKDLLSEKNLPRDFAEYLLAEDDEKTLERVNAFEKVFNEELSKRVDEKFKENGRIIDDKQYSTTKNPFMPGEHYNLTEQGKLFKEDPERARALMAAAQKAKK